VALPVNKFAVIPGAFWLDDTYVAPREKFAKQVLDGNTVVDLDKLQASSTPPLALTQVVYSWTSSVPGLVITGANLLNASYTPPKAGDYNITLSVFDGCKAYLFYFVQRAECLPLVAGLKLGSNTSATPAALTFRNRRFDVVTIQADPAITRYNDRPDYFAFNKLSYRWLVLSSPAGSKYLPSSTDNDIVLTGPAETFNPDDDVTVTTIEQDLYGTTQTVRTRKYEVVSCRGNRTRVAELRNHGNCDPQASSEGRASSMSTGSQMFGQEARTCLQPDLPGEYQVQLEIMDNCGQKVTTTAITISATCPTLFVVLAHNNPLAVTASGRGKLRVVLDATPTETTGGQSVLNGNSLTFKWTLVTKPRGSSLLIGDDSFRSITNSQAALASFTPDSNGQYTFSVSVYDGCKQAALVVTVIVGCGASMPLVVSADRSLLSYTMTNKFGVSNIVGSVGATPCNVRGWAWRLVDFKCSNPLPAAAPPPPAALDAICAPRFAYQWRLKDAPCQSQRTTADIDSGNEAIAKFKPDVPGQYTFVLKVSDDCSSAEDTLILYAKCMQKVTATIASNGTYTAPKSVTVVSCSKDSYDPIALTGGVAVQRTTGVDSETTCAVATATVIPPIPPAVPKRCCPPCPSCPTCPRGTFLTNASECAAPVCPACDCPPNITVTPAPAPQFRRSGHAAERDDQHVPFDAPVFSPPNWNPPPSSLFSQPSGVARAVAVGAEGRGAALKRADTVSLTILVNADLDTIAATEEQYA
jgi:hypothetical protein